MKVWNDEERKVLLARFSKNSTMQEDQDGKYSSLEE
jgi:hypothetical protein